MPRKLVFAADIAATTFCLINFASAGVIGLSETTPSKHAAKVVKEVMHDQKAEHGHAQA